MTEATVDDHAADWVAYAQYGPDNVPDDVGVLAQFMIGPDIPLNDPELAWATIRKVVDNFEMADLEAENASTAQKVVGRLAAGPIEDLLSYHGPDFIDRVEAAARSDQRMRWALGGAWRYTMTDEIWARVQAAARDNEYWSRPSV